MSWRDAANVVHQVRNRDSITLCGINAYTARSSAAFTFGNEVPTCLVCVTATST